MQPAKVDLQAIGAARRAGILVLYYAISLMLVFVFLLGALDFALLLIFIAEAIAYLWRPTPKLGPTSYAAPTPAAWETPIRAWRWYEIVSGLWTAAGAVIVLTVFFAIVGILFIVSMATGHYSLGAANYAVAVVVGVWLLTRPLWHPTLVKALSQSTQGLRQDLSVWAPAVYVTADGFDIDFKSLIVGFVGRRNRLIHLTFAELDDVRMLTWNDAAAYGQSLTTYDTTLVPRMAWEFTRFIQGTLERPSVILYTSYGAHLLLHGPTLLYLIGAGDAWAPGALAAWQAWQAAHITPKAPTP